MKKYKTLAKIDIILLCLFLSSCQHSQKIRSLAAESGEQSICETLEGCFDLRLQVEKRIKALISESKNPSFTTPQVSESNKFTSLEIAEKHCLDKGGRLPTAREIAIHVVRNYKFTMTKPINENLCPENHTFHQALNFNGSVDEFCLGSGLADSFAFTRGESKLDLLTSSKPISSGKPKMHGTYHYFMTHSGLRDGLKTAVSKSSGFRCVMPNE